MIMLYVVKFFLLSVLFISFVQIKSSEASNEDYIDVFDISLEDLQKIKVTSASKQEEEAFRSPGAVYVITNEDIKRSAATSIPELLRLAPGVNVAKIDSITWAISIRGFNRQYSNKLLVLFDGRSVYTPLFSGVYWDAQDYILDDIDRIEVIRGPGGSLWGANAVNGIINIITKKAQDTVGSYASVTVGNHDKFIGEVRDGRKIKHNNAFYRVYAKYLERGETTNLDDKSDANDDWYMSRAGFKYETDPDQQNIYTIQGDFYDGNLDEDHFLPKNTINGTMESNGDEKVEGGNIMVKLDREYVGNKKLNAHFYIDYENRDILPLRQRKLTYDADFQYKFKKNHKNTSLVGVNYRYISDNLNGRNIDGVTYLDYTPQKMNYDIISGFIQNKTSISNNIFFTIGSKFSHNDFTHFEVQPTARLSYFPKSNHHLWLAISKAVRTPTRGENGLLSIATYSNDYKTYVMQQGNSNYDSEKLIAYEIGYKFKLVNKLSFDISSFYNDYDNMRTFYQSGATYNVINSGKAKSYGFELSGMFEVNKNWRLSSSYAFLKVETEFEDKDHINNEGISPQNQFNFRSTLNFLSKFELDNTLYFNDNLNPQYSSKDVDAYFKFDSRLAYNLNKKTQINIIGQNLFDKRHQEFSGEAYSKSIEIGRYFAIQYKYRF
jgi:iron complex outermembrane receptor protein